MSLEYFGGHQVNFFVQFLADMEPNIDRSRVEVAELKAISHHRLNGGSDVRTVARIVVGISCGELERHKIPSPSFFAQLLNSVARHQSIQLLVIGSTTDRPLIDELCCLLSTRISIELVIDLPIEELIERIGECNLGISGTTGQGHMMAAAGLPMLVLAGVTNPYESGPYVQRAAVLRHRYACGPCYQVTYRIGCGRVACMETLDVEEGARLALQLLRDSDFGSDWLYKSPKLAPVSITTITALHTRPPAEWVLSQDNQ
jgi:ADP-heptose:LPS heptosyltransferase